MATILDHRVEPPVEPFDEMGTAATCRPQYAAIRDWLGRTPAASLQIKRREAEIIFRRTGITFAVRDEGGDPERLIPFDIIPRLLDAAEWSFLARGLEQRVRGINAFLGDVYGAQDFIRAGKIPPEMVFRNPGFTVEIVGLPVAEGIYTHISGIEIVRTGPEQFYVLEDNCRTPSGVSYMLENREAMMRLFPDLFARHRVRPVSHYPEELLGTLRSVAPSGVRRGGADESLSVSLNVKTAVAQ